MMAQVTKTMTIGELMFTNPDVAPIRMEMCIRDRIKQKYLGFTDKMVQEKQRLLMHCIFYKK